jgi:pyruvate/2-oxoglutarate/acetoin dehydrogenase E1 component
MSSEPLFYGDKYRLVDNGMVQYVPTYFDEIRRSMAMLAEHPKTLFVGQAVRYGGQRAASSFDDVPMDRRIEMPVIEDFQVGFSTGLALEGFIPVSFFPRWDFLVIAANQLVNHLDKIPLVSGYRPKVILRTAVGSSSPLNPGPQHTQDHTEAFRKMFKSIHIITLDEARTVYSKYCGALAMKQSVLVVEKMELYNT